jgi:hypothetical protein
LTTGEAIGRGWLGRRRGILLPKGELSFQVRDLSIALGQFFAEPVILPL